MYQPELLCENGELWTGGRSPQPRSQAQHTHGPRVEEGLHCRAVTSMKELVTSDSRPIPEAYENVAIALHMQYPVAASTLPTQTSLKSTFLRGRRFIYPPLPVAIDNLHNIPDVFSNIGEDRSLLSPNTLNEGQYGLLVFCTNDGLR